LEIQSYEEILYEVFKKYNKKPNNWKVLISRNASGFWDVVFSNNEEAWIIKLDTIFKANPIGIGVKLDEEIKKDEIDDFPYGFRPIPKPLIRNLTKEIQEKNLSLEEASKKIINELKAIPPKPITIAQQSPITAVGPHHILQKLPLSQKQKSLDKILNEQLRKTLRVKYPWYEF
jgi:hypothetical protein